MDYNRCMGHSWPSAGPGIKPVEFTMSLSNNIETYRDVEEYLNRAIMAGGLRLTLPTAGSAVRWRQRAYNFRKLYRSLQQELYAHAPTMEERAKAGKSPWDGWVIRATDNIITIEYESDPVMAVETLDGEPVYVDTLSAGQVLDALSGPARPQVFGELGLEVDNHNPVGFTKADAERARKAVADLMKE